MGAARTKRMTSEAVSAVYKSIAENGAMDGEFWKYRTGKSDRAIAADFGVHYQVVAKIRRDAFGECQKGQARTPGRPPTLRSDMKMLKRRVDVLETLYNEMLLRIGEKGGGTA